MPLHVTPDAPSRPDDRPLIAHVVHRLDFGGLENGLANLLHRLPEERFRHAVVSLTDYSSFRERLPADVPVIALHRRAGQDWGLYLKLWRTFRALRPALVHTRNLATLEAQVAAWAAGVPARVHGEHGRDVHDLDNRSRRYVWMRRILSPLVQRYTAVSRELSDYVTGDVGIAATRVTRICNGVDTQRFSPQSPQSPRPPLPDAEAAGRLGGRLLVGTIGRMQAVKDPLNLVKAWIALCRQHPCLGSRAGLVMVGEGPLRPQAQALLAEAGLAGSSWLPGARHDTAEILRTLHLFALPSLAEGISNTILEAMASGLPVVATDVGGNSELVQDGITGQLVPRDQPQALAQALASYLEDGDLRDRHGTAARERAVREFSLDVMVSRYCEIYESLTPRPPGY
jgi:sugar transferase (PEP-CTERM/EpsH1 system associated)